MTRVSLAELASAGFVLHSAEAAALVVEVCRQYSSGLVSGIPSAHVIRLTPDGSVVAEGPITTDHPPLAKAAHLLSGLLPPFGAPPAYRVPGELRLVVARALGTFDLPPFKSLEAFSSAVARFAAADLTSTAQSLYRAWEYAREPRVPTATPLLRQLEWGYLKNWRNDSDARTWLAGYARAAGLDEQLVAAIVSGPPVRVRGEVVRSFRPKRTRTILRASVSAAAIALVAYAVTMGLARAPMDTRAGSPQKFVPEFVSADAPLERMAAPLPVRLTSAVQTIQMRPAAPAHVSKARSPAKHAFAAPAAPRRPAKPSFFKRTLLRIVIVK